MALPEPTPPEPTPPESERSAPPERGPGALARDPDAPEASGGDVAAPRPDWLVGAEEGVAAEFDRGHDGPAATKPPLVLRRPAAPEGAGRRDAAPPPGAKTPVPWTAAASSVPMLPDLEASQPSRAAPRPPMADEVADFPDDDLPPAVDPVAPVPVLLPLREPVTLVALDAVRTSRMIQIGILVALAAAAAYFFWPRPNPTLSLSSIRLRPELYDGRTVVVSGKVGDVFPVGAGYAFYLLERNDTLVVFTRTRTPKSRTHLRVTGTVSTGYLDGVPRPALFESP